MLNPDSGDEKWMSKRVCHLYLENTVKFAESICLAGFWASVIHTTESFVGFLRKLTEPINQFELFTPCEMTSIIARLRVKLSLEIQEELKMHVPMHIANRGYLLFFSVSYEL